MSKVTGGRAGELVVLLFASSFGGVQLQAAKHTNISFGANNTIGALSEKPEGNTPEQTEERRERVRVGQTLVVKSAGVVESSGALWPVDTRRTAHGDTVSGSGAPVAHNFSWRATQVKQVISQTIT